MSTFISYSSTLGAPRQHYGEEFHTDRIAKGLLIMYLAHHKKKYYLPTLFGPFIGCKQILIVWLHDGRCQYNLLLVTNVVSYYVMYSAVQSMDNGSAVFGCESSPISRNLR